MFQQKIGPCICLLLSILAATQFSYGQNVPLELGTPVEREIAGGQKHEFQIVLTAGQYAKVAIEQIGVNIAATSLNPDGKTLVLFDAEPRNTGEETIEVVSEAAGNISLSVEPRQKSARAGRYRIRLLERRDAGAKDIALDEARKSLTQANGLWIAGSYSEALPPAEKALAIRTRELGPEHADTGQATFVLGNIVGDLGDLAKCETLYARALEVREKALGKNHPTIGSILNNWAIVHSVRGDYVKAEALHQRALEIKEKTLDPDHLSIADSLNNLAGISRTKNDIEKATAYYKRALTIRENALGPEHPAVATSLNNLANLYEDPAISEPLYRRSLAIREKVLGPEHQDVAQSLYNLARIYGAANDLQKAEITCRRALSIFEKTLGPEHQFISYPLNLLAVIYKMTGDYGQSETLFLRAASLKEKTQSPFHPELGGTFANLANLYAAKGEMEKAIAAQTRANEIYEYNTALNLTVGSEREKFDYLKTLTAIENQTLTINFLAKANRAAAAELAATSVLRRKGRVLDAMSDSFAAMRRRFDKQDQLLLDSLNEATAKLVSFVLDGGPGNSPDDYRLKLKKLEGERDAVESRISRRSSGSYEPQKLVTLDTVRAAIPADAVLLEFTVYRPISPKLSEFAPERGLDPKTVDNSRYAVFVVGAKGVVRGQDLGPVSEIDAKVAALRQALRDPNRKDARRLARVLDQKIMQPVRSLAGAAKHFLISPDGGLNLIPFEALVDEKDSYLVENYSIAYLTSGRDLLRMQIGRESKNKSLVIANPSFGAPSKGLPAVTRNKPQSMIVTRNLTDTFFAPLGGTMREARSIQTLFPDAAFLTGVQATESALKQTAAPHILHIASHGFFLENTGDPSSKNIVENPLLRSGIALAGANRRGGGNDDGILTALEASGLNLWGTKLVVLSACDTGLGEVKNGEGVYGLRRAFVIAGTESLMMSLWPVSDDVTRELMTNYYKNLKLGTGRGESLRRVQLEMLKKSGRQHPFYWAAFIQSGEWANLEGNR